MATAQLNPVINSVSGSVGALVFYERRGKTIMRAHIIPPNPKTPAQQKNRSRFRDAMLSWQGLSAHEKASCNATALKLGMTGHNLYISRFMKKKGDYDADASGCERPSIHKNGRIQTCGVKPSCRPLLPEERWPDGEVISLIPKSEKRFFFASQPLPLRHRSVRRSIP